MKRPAVSNGRRSYVRRWIQALGLGLATAMLGCALSLTPVGVALEEEYGLDWLLKLRGERPPPSDAVVVALDKESAVALGLPTKIDRWSRKYHAQLVGALTRMGASVIVFDILFREPRDREGDQAFADAIKNAGNVVLFADLESEQKPIPELRENGAEGFIKESMTPPIPLLANAAQAVVPFTLPKIPHQVRQYWTFREASGGAPTLPVVSLQLFASPVIEDFLDLVRNLRPDYEHLLPSSADIRREQKGILPLMRTLQSLFAEDPELADQLIERLSQTGVAQRPHNSRQILIALSRTYAQGNSRYLNFYGGPRTITTVPYHHVLSRDDSDSATVSGLDVAGKAVFVGLSEQLPQSKEDNFDTVFSREDGVYLAGIEIAATAFANLLTNESIRPLSPPGYLALIFVWGLIMGALSRLRTASLALVVAVVGGVAYIYAAYVAFDVSHLWLPTTIPVFFQVPVACFIAVVWYYLDSIRQRLAVKHAFSHYIPSEVVERITSDEQGVKAGGQTVFGTCLFTDAAQYTRLSEQLDPETLGQLMNEYYGAIFAPVRRRDGIVSDVVGDAMLAIWTRQRAGDENQKKACSAALEIRTAVETFNRIKEPLSLPTRVGLHSGQMLLGNVGAGDHYEYRAVGDIVNTATRIQELNKRLGTRILASKETVEGDNEILTRTVGKFILPGKTKPLIIHELLCGKTDTTPDLEKRIAIFYDAMEAMAGRKWHDALDRLLTILESAPSDGPARFYQAFCEHHLRNPDVAWDGIIRFDKK